MDQVNCNSTTNLIREKYRECLNYIDEISMNKIKKMLLHLKLINFKGIARKWTQRRLKLLKTFF